jgi:hypothetical protein
MVASQVIGAERVRADQDDIRPCFHYDGKKSGTGLTGSV